MEILNRFDSSQSSPIGQEADIAALFLPVVSGNQMDDIKVFAEYWAFAIREGLLEKQKAWKGYFDPGLITGDDGTNRPKIDLAKISAPIIDYWAERATQVENPILKARYSGLVWELSKPVSDRRPPFGTGVMYLENLIASSTSKKFSHSSTIARKIERAIILASNFKRKDLLDNAIATWRTYEREMGKIDKPGIWKYSYLLFVKNKLVEDEQIKKEIIKELEEKLAQAVTPDELGKVETNSAEAATDMLTEYFHAAGLTEQVKRVIKKLESGYNAVFNNIRPFMKEHRLRMLLRYYKKYDFKDEADRILIRLKQIGPDILEEMKPVPMEMTLSKDEVNAFSAPCFAGVTSAEIFACLGKTFIPDEKMTLNFFEGSATYQLLTKGLYDHSGRNVAQVGPAASDPQGDHFQKLSSSMHFQSIFLRYALEAAMDKGILSAGEVKAYVQACPLILPETDAIIQIGIESFFSGDYITMVHLLIPQIEAACLNLLETAGGSRWEPGRSGGFNLKIFNKVLYEKEFISAFGRREAEYFRVLFTEPVGWNLRNKVCHGMMRASSFTRTVAERVLVALLLICSIGMEAEAGSKT